MFIASYEFIAKQVDGKLITLKINIGTPEPDPL
jgi:hypothetical protein